MEEPIIIKKIFAVSKEKLWSALTDIKEMKLWFFEILEDFKPEIGFTTKFLITNEGRNFTHIWKVTEVVPYQKITTNWTFTEYEGDSFVSFIIAEKDNGLELTLHAEVTKSFPSDIPEFKRESGVGGWEYFINQRLSDYLNKN